MELIVQGDEHLKASMVPLYPSKTGAAFRAIGKQGGGGSSN